LTLGHGQVNGLTSSQFIRTNRKGHEMGTADDMKKLGEDIVASYDMRIKALEELVKDTHKMLKGFEREHKERADEHKEKAANLRTDLAKGEDNRIKIFNAMMAETQKAIEGIEVEVKKKLKEFSSAHTAMSKEQKKELAQYVHGMVKATEDLMSDIQQRIKDIRKRQKERKAEVVDLKAEAVDLLEGFKAESEKMAANWQALTATMAKRRKGHPAPPKFEARKKVTTTTVEQILGEGKPKRKTAKKRPAKKRPPKKELVDSFV
jgi:hypothetical protein